jgi:hypothetical protein
MKKKLDKKMIWVPVNCDDLRLIDKAVSFLQQEFQPIGANLIWSEEYFKWKLGACNPAGKGYVSLAMLDDKVVGIVSLTRKRLLVNGRQVAGGEVGDTYSSTRVRRGAQPNSLSVLDPNPKSFMNMSIFGRLASDVRERAQADGVQVIYGTPNSYAYPGWTKRLGYFDYLGYENQSFSRPTWLMLIKRYPALALFRRFIRLAECALIKIHASLCREINNDLVFETLSLGEKEIEELWERVKPTSGFSLVRDGAYWRHRYFDHPLAKYSIFGVRSKGVLVAICVVRLTTIGGEKKVLSVVEWMTEKKVPFSFLLTQILEFYRGWKIDSFNLWASAVGEEANAAQKCFFVRRNRVPIIFSDNVVGCEIAALKDSFYFYIGSVDAV